jgi:tetratricopeptide (TPR) repeat protein
LRKAEDEKKAATEEQARLELAKRETVKANAKAAEAEQLRKAAEEKAQNEQQARISWERERRAKIEDALSAAASALESQRYTEARRQYERTLALDDENSQAKAGLARVEKAEMEAKAKIDANSALQRVDFADARRAYQTLLAADPGNVVANAGLTEVDKAEKAETAAKAVASARSAFQKGNYAEARRLFGAILESDATNARAKAELVEIDKAEKEIETQRTAATAQTKIESSKQAALVTPPAPPPRREGSPTALDLVAEANKLVGPQSQDKIVQIRSKKSATSLAPSTWILVLYDVQADWGAKEVIFEVGKPPAVNIPTRILELFSSDKNPFDRELIKIDSDVAIKSILDDPKLKNISVKATELSLQHGDKDTPIWKIRVWALKRRDPRHDTEIGEVWISATDGKVIRSDLHPQRVD